jgi:hypothetical protein
MSDSTIHRSGERDLQPSFRILIIGACALVSWAVVTSIGFGLVRLLGY